MKKLIFIILILFCLIPSVYAQDEVNLQNFPSRLSVMLTIDMFSARILASMIMLSIFLLPTLFIASAWKRDPLIPALIVGLGSLGLCVALAWFPVWIMVILCLLIAIFGAEKITGKL